ncbi:MAG: glycosyltransferase family 9 protein [bacterium]|nr:glycosyltransferase family 9 protein [bacterium]
MFRAIKTAYPQSKLSVVAANKTIGIIKHNPRIDHLINFNDIPFKGWLGRWRFFRYINRERYDYVISLTNNPLNSLIALSSAAPFRIKTVIPKRSVPELLTDWFNNYRYVYRPGTFLQSHYLLLLEVLHIHTDETKKEVFPTAYGDQKTDDFFIEHGISGRNCVIGITPTAGNKIKEWPRDRFVELADELIRREQAKIVFIDAGSNRHIVLEMIPLMHERKEAVAATDFTLEELPSLIKRLSLFIAVDTGSIYIAHALGVPLIDIIGPVDPHEQPPSDTRSIQILPPPHIKPSSFVLTPPISGARHEEAVRSITVQNVLKAAEELLRVVKLKNPEKNER